MISLIDTIISKRKHWMSKNEESDLFKNWDNIYRKIRTEKLSKGIAKERISGKGFGESKPAVECGENCSDEQRQTNRRSEFVIIKK